MSHKKLEILKYEKMAKIIKHGPNWAIVGQNAPRFCALAKGWPFKPLGTLGSHSTLLRNVQLLHSLLRVSQGPWSCLFQHKNAAIDQINLPWKSSILFHHKL